MRQRLAARREAAVQKKGSEQRFMIDTLCQQPIQDGQAAIFGMDRGDGKLLFGWTCCHKPVGDVAVIIAASTCMEKWNRVDTEYVEEICKLLDAHAKEHPNHGL